MKIKMNTPITDLAGKPIVEYVDMKDGLPVPGTEKHLTLQTVSLAALTGVFEDERSLSGEEKFKRFQLALKVNIDGEVDLLPEEVTIIKTLIGKAYAPLVVGRAYEVLNG